MAGDKSILGVDSLYYALVTQDDADAYVVGTPVFLAPSAQIDLDPGVNQKTQYFDNGPKENLYGKGPTKISAEIQGMNLATYAALLGWTYDTATGVVSDNGQPPPDVAIGFRSLKSNGKYRYYWFRKGNCAEPKESFKTKSDTPDPQTLKLELTMLQPIHTWALTSGLTDFSKFSFADEDDANFTGESTWFSGVHTPTVGAPAALTCAPSPADAATGQATGVAIMLTFSNPIGGGYPEKMVTLTRVDTGALIALTPTWNAARTVLTLGHAALTSGTKQYFITVPQIVDVHQQTFAGAVYDFTTA